MRQAGRYLPEYRALRRQARHFLDFCYTPELAIEATLQPIRRFAMDGAILFSDILVIPDALGAEVRFVEGEGPRLAPLEDAADIARLDLERMPGHLAPVYAALRGLQGRLPPKATLIGFAGAPWTLAAYMVEGGGSRDFARARLFARRQPETFQSLIDLLCEAVARHLLAQAEAGAEAVQIFDSWAGVLPEAEFARWCLEPARRIVARLTAERPDLPVILFPRGAGVLYEKVAREVPAHALGLDTTVPLAFARDRLRPTRPGGLCLQGNLDPVALLAGGDAVLAEADRLLAMLGDGPLVVNLGHGVLPQTDPEVVARLVAHLKS